MAEFLEGSSELESTTIGVYRSAATMAGGRRFSFGSLVVVGNRQGRVALGYGKANEVPPAIEKAQKDAKKNLKTVTLQGGTIPHRVVGRFGASTVTLLPASPGTGVVAGATVRAVLEMSGITDCMTKCTGSTNSKNLAKAVLNGLEQLRSKESIANLRGVTIDKTEVDERIERGAAFAPSAGSDADRVKGPVNRVGEDSRGGRGGGGRGGRGGNNRGGGRGRGGDAPAAPSEAAPASDS